MNKFTTIILTVLLFSAFLMVLSGCNDDSPAVKNTPPVEITVPIIESGIEFPEMVEKNLGDLDNRYFSIKTDGIEEASFWINPAGANPDEITVIKCDSADTANNLKAFFEDYVQGKISEWKDYQPGEMHKFDNVVITVRGNYIALFICADTAKALEVFNEMI